MASTETQGGPTGPSCLGAKRLPPADRNRLSVVVASVLLWPWMPSKSGQVHMLRTLWMTWDSLASKPPPGLGTTSWLWWFSQARSTFWSRSRASSADSVLAALLSEGH